MDGAMDRNTLTRQGQISDYSIYIRMDRGSDIKDIRIFGHGQ